MRKGNVPAVKVLPLPGGPCRSATSPLPLPATRSSSEAVLSTYEETIAWTMSLYSVSRTSRFHAFLRKETGLNCVTLSCSFLGQRANLCLGNNTLTPDLVTKTVAENLLWTEQ